jgi:hypothetical protein
MSFEPERRPRLLKTNIVRITKHVTKRITEIGLDVFVTYSATSKSRYLRVPIRKNNIIVRISDHPMERWSRWKYQFDIHTERRRRGSVDYIEFIDALKTIIGERRV